MKAEMVWVLVINHKHYADVYAFREKDAAHAKLAAYAREYWRDVRKNENDDPPAADREVISRYFYGNEHESYEIEAVYVE